MARGTHYTCAMNKTNSPITRLPPAVSPSAGCPLVVRAGDFMQVADTLRLALELAEEALTLAEYSGALPRRVWLLRSVLEGLRG